MGELITTLKAIRASLDKAVMQDDAVEMTRLIKLYSQILHDLYKKRVRLLPNSAQSITQLLDRFFGGRSISKLQAKSGQIREARRTLAETTMLSKEK